MRQSHSRLAFGVAAAALLLGIGVAVPVQAQVSMTDPDAAVACTAFQRGANGAWMATTPTVLNFNTGISLPIRPGQTFLPNHTTGGVEVSAVLDRHCGNM